MKRTVMALLIATGVTLGVNAQEKEKKEVDRQNVPQEVQNSFKSKFANASDVEWKMKEDKYVAKFDMNNADHFAKFDASGTVIAVGNEIASSELPQVVADAIKKDHAGYTIDDVYKVIEGGNTNYKVSLDGATDRKVLYSSDGKMIKDKIDD